MKLIYFLSNELINLRKGIGAIFYQHFYCIDSKIDVYGRPVTANFKSYFEINCKLFEVKTICALKWKNELTTKNLSKPSETCRTYLQMQIEIPRLRLPV